MHQTKESNKRAPGQVVIYISVHLVLIYTLALRNVLLVLALDLTVHKSSYCKCSLAWCQARTFLLFTIWTHPLQMREYPLRYASTDKNKKSHYSCLWNVTKHLFFWKFTFRGGAWVIQSTCKELPGALLESRDSHLFQRLISTRSEGILSTKLLQIMTKGWC